MGGRGSSSGLGSYSSSYIRKQLPKNEEFEIMRRKSLPELEGTEKQVRWANKIREGIMKELFDYTIKRTSEGNPADLFRTATHGTDEIVKRIEYKERTIELDPRVNRERIDREISSFKDLAKRISKFNEIAKNKSASFWIDNRTDWSNNYMNKKFKKKIDS